MKRHSILKYLGKQSVVLMQENTLQETDVTSTVAETSPKSVSPQHHQNPSAAREISE
jgi:hypothetical protein